MDRLCTVLFFFVFFNLSEILIQRVLSHAIPVAVEKKSPSAMYTDFCETRLLHQLLGASLTSLASPFSELVNHIS